VAKPDCMAQLVRYHISGHIIAPSYSMRLRQHPIMSYRGDTIWPPEWTWVSGNYDKCPDGEAGVLENVRVSAINDQNLFLTMSYGGGRYIATLMFDHPDFCQQACEMLKHHRGWLIKMIGELAIP